MLDNTKELLGIEAGQCGEFFGTNRAFVSRSSLLERYPPPSRLQRLRNALADGWSAFRDSWRPG
jgi:hypothetical protein